MDLITKEDLLIIGGDTVTIGVEVFTDDGSAFDASGYTCMFLVCRQTSPRAVMSVIGTLSEDKLNEFEIVLPTSETEKLAGHYEYQIVISKEELEFRRIFGAFTVVQGIQNE